MQFHPPQDFKFTYYRVVWSTKIGLLRSNLPNPSFMTKGTLQLQM